MYSRRPVNAASSAAWSVTRIKTMFQGVTPVVFQKFIVHMSLQVEELEAPLRKTLLLL
jgi:hypothetical protein